MNSDGRSELIRRFFEAYETGNRGAAEAMQTADFTFSSRTMIHWTKRAIMNAAGPTVA